jgi:hypothetical protein
MLFELTYSIDHIAAIDNVVAVEYAASLSSTDAYDQAFRDAGTAHIAGTCAAKIME